MLRKGAEENSTCVKNRLPMGCREGLRQHIFNPQWRGGGQGDKEWQVLSGLYVDLPCMEGCGELTVIVALTKNYL